MAVQNKRLDHGKFMAMRKKVLSLWPTGSEVDLQDAIGYHKSLPIHKSFPRKLQLARKNAKVLMQPRGGAATPGEHVNLLKYLQAEGSAELLPTTVDSYTRQNRYQDADIGIKESIEAKKSILRGFPLVNHGVSISRQITKALGVPIQVRHGSPDARLLAEVSYAGGFSSFEGGGISHNIPYFKNVSLEKSISDWQYVDRLTGLYEEAGIAIDREPFGPLTGTLVPPFIAHAIAVIESLLAAEQGVRNITVGYGHGGNLIQDVAAMQALQELTEDYLAQNGYPDCFVCTAMHQWMGGFSSDPGEAFSMIAWGGATAALAGATKVVTPHEWLGEPTEDSLTQGLHCTRHILSTLGGQRMDSACIQEEKERIVAETRCVVDRCFQLGEGDIAIGCVRAFETGVLDVPFAPSRNNAGKLFSARDKYGAIRVLEAGNVPLSRELLDFNRSKIEERARAEKRNATFQMVIEDISANSNGQLIRKPYAQR